MQAAQHAAHRARDIALDEVRRQADGNELVAVERLVEETTIIAEHVRLDDEAARQVGFDNLHQAIGPCSSRSEEHTSELQSLMRISYAVFCLKKKKNTITKTS